MLKYGKDKPYLDLMTSILKMTGICKYQMTFLPLGILGPEAHKDS